MGKFVFEMTPTGGIQGMYADKMDMTTLGHVEVSRASEIAFDEQAQAWTIELMVANVRKRVPVAHSFRSYEQARSVEVDWLNKCRTAGVDPMSAEGLSYFTDLV